MVHEQKPVYLGSLLLGSDIDMNFGTRPARPCIAHFPEVIFFVSVNDTLFRQVLQPVTGSLVVALQILSGASFKNGCVEPVRIEFQYLHKIFPCPGNGFFFEIITERPVSQHFKHRVVISVVSYLFQIVVLAAHSQTFLRICHPRIFNRGVTQNNIFKLIHAGICKHQRRVVLNHHRSRRHNLVVLGCKKIFKRLANFF